MIMKQLKLFFVLVLFSIMFGTAQAANITAQLDREPVLLDESFRLVLEAEGKVDNNPDFSVLEKDFDIINTSQSTNMTFVNGNFTQKAVWSLTLVGKQAGTFTIPSINFGKDQSPALRITIKDSANTPGKARANTDKQLFLEVETDINETWVQSQIVYTIRLVRTVNINNATLTELETSDPDAIIEKLGDDTSYESFRDGVRYVVNERRYAVYPQHSGELEFKPIVFEGRITGSSRSALDPFMQGGRLKRARSKSLTVNIKPRPADIKTSEWLPAKSISLIEEWSEAVDQLKTGEPVTRTITIIADGLMAAHLPELKLPQVEGIKQYSDQAVPNDEKKTDGVTAARQIKIALIPTRNGEFKLPAFTLPWWNTQTGEKQIARLPEQTLKASGAIEPAQAQSATPAPALQTLGAAETTSKPTFVTESQNPSSERPSYWAWISLALAIGWSITLFIMLFGKPESGAIIASTEPSLRVLEKAVLTQCQTNNAQQTKNALLKWAQARWPEQSIISLADITHRVPGETGQQIEALNSVLYGPVDTHWDGQELAKAFKNLNISTPDQKPAPSSALEPLYKV